MASQDRLGWDSLIEGRLSYEWGEVQQRYLTYIGSRRTGKRWLVAVIKKLWTIAWNFWQDRNEINVDKRTRRQRKELEERVQQEFTNGYATLVYTDRSLFSRFPMEVRISQSTQTLSSWLLRVAMARERSSQLTVTTDQESEWSKNRRLREERRQRNERIQANQQARMADWLGNQTATNTNP